MTEDCKELEKKAKELEKNDVSEAIVKYKEASECYSKYDKTKNKKSNLANAAKLLRELGKSNEDPTIALDYYEEASSIYTKIEKVAEAEKVIKEAFQKFVDSAKLIILDARKMDDIEAAEKRFKLASQYARLGENEALSNKAWIESGDQFYKAAKVLEDPREAFEVFKHSIINYNRGKAVEKQNSLLMDAAEKFHRKGTEIFKTNKTLVLGLDNYIQAISIYQIIKSEQRVIDVEKRIQEICDKIGIPRDPIVNYLDLQGIKAISFDDVIQVIPVTKVATVDKSQIDFVDKESGVEPSTMPPAPEVIEEIESPAEPIFTEQETPKQSSILEIEDIPDKTKFEIPTSPIEEIDPLVHEKTEDHKIEQTTSKFIDDGGESFDSVVQKETHTPIPKPVAFEEPVVEPDIIPEPQTEEGEIPKVEEPVIEPEIIPEPQMEEIETQKIEEPVIEPEIIPEPQMEEIETQKTEEPVIEPEIIAETQMEEKEITKSEEPIAEPTMSQSPKIMDEIVEDFESDIIQPEIQEAIPDPKIEKTLPDPLVYGIKKEFKIKSTPEPHKSERESPKDEDPIITSQPKSFEKVDKVKSKIVSGLKPMNPVTQETKQDMRQNSFDPSIDQPEVSDLADKTGGSNILSESIIDILRKQGYVNDDMRTEDELMHVSEYQILSFLVDNHPVPLEEIEEKTDVSSVSLSLSNLQADGLIEQTNDYQWTISQKVKNSID